MCLASQDSKPKLDRYRAFSKTDRVRSRPVAERHGVWPILRAQHGSTTDSMSSRRGVSVFRAARLSLRAVLVLIGAVTLVFFLVFSVRVWYTSGRHRAVPAELQVQAHVSAFPDEVRYFPRDPGDHQLIE